MTDESGKTPPQIMQQCIDAKTDQMMSAFSGGIGAEMCSKQEMRKVGATLVINAECQIGPMRSVSRERGVRRLQQQLHRSRDDEGGRPSGGSAGHGRRHEDYSGQMDRAPARRTSGPATS